MRKSDMNSQCKLRRLCALIFAGATLSYCSNSACVQTQPAAQSLDGLWLTDGYGMLIEFQGDTLRSYEITTVSCIASAKAKRTMGAGSQEIVFAGDDGTLRILPATSQDTRWLHEDGSVSNILLHRASSRPKPCRQALADTPRTNYQVFWQTFSENYPFFAL